MSSSVTISPKDREFGYTFSFSYAPSILANKEKNIPNDIKGTLNGMSVMNVMGYIPLISVISGIARIIFALTHKLFDQKQNGGETREK